MASSISFMNIRLCNKNCVQILKNEWKKLANNTNIVCANVWAMERNDIDWPGNEMYDSCEANMTTACHMVMCCNITVDFPMEMSVEHKPFSKTYAPINEWCQS